MPASPISGCIFGYCGCIKDIWGSLSGSGDIIKGGNAFYHRVSRLVKTGMVAAKVHGALLPRAMRTLQKFCMKTQNKYNKKMNIPHLEIKGLHYGVVL